MSESTPENTQEINPESNSEPSTINVNPSPSMVTPRNQVVLEPQNSMASSMEPSPAIAATDPAAQPAQNPTPAADVATSEVAWPDAQQASEGVVESDQIQPNTKSGSKIGLIVGLLILLGILIGVYVALSAF